MSIMNENHNPEYTGSGSSMKSVINLIFSSLKPVSGYFHFCIPILCYSSSVCSPIGEIFRARLRQFPSLVTCCTIDWFSEWPEQALISVANTFISEMPEVDPEKTNFDGLVRRTLVFLSKMFLGRLLSTYS